MAEDSLLVGGAKDPETTTQADAGESGSVDWRSQLPTEFQTDKAFANFKTVGDLAKSYTESRKFISASVRVPPTDAPKEEWDRFNRAMGVPESADKYTKLDKTQIPEGSEYDEDQEKWLDGVAFKLGLSDQKAIMLKQELNVKGFEADKATDQERIEERAAAEEALKKELGKAYTPSLAVAARFAKNIGGEEFLNFLDDSRVGNNPAFIRFMIKVSKLTAQDRSIDGSRGVEDYGVSPEDARIKIAEIRRDKNHPFNAERHPDHKKAVAEMSELYAYAHPAEG